MAEALKEARGYKGRRTVKGSGDVQFLRGSILTGKSQDGELILELRQNNSDGSVNVVGLLIPLDDVSSVVEAMKEVS